MAEEPNDKSAHVRLLTRVLRDTLKDDVFVGYADLKDVFQARLARLKIWYDSDVVSRAMNLVESNRGLVTPERTVSEPFQAEPRTINRDEALQICTALLERYEQEFGPTETAPMERTAECPEHFPNLVEVRW